MITKDEIPAKHIVEHIMPALAGLCNMLRRKKMRHVALDKIMFSGYNSGKKKGLSYGLDAV